MDGRAISVTKDEERVLRGGCKEANESEALAQDD